MHSVRMKVLLVFLPILFVAGAMMAQVPVFQQVGTLHEVMLGIVKPTSDIIFQFQNDPPKTAADWALLQNAALTLGETGNLLLLPGRAKDTGDWTKFSKAMVDAGSATFKAANAKDAKALSDAGDKVYDTCENCHTKYLPKPAQ